jgi:GNAT superfamily N-acetyltransferase
MAATCEIRRIDPAESRALRRDVLRPHQTLAELAAAERADGLALGAYADGTLVATGSIIADGPGSWRVRGMATAPHARGRGAGTALLEALIEHARAERARRVWCNARTPALSLYRRAGFVETSGEFELPRIGPHVRMELVLAPD